MNKSGLIEVVAEHLGESRVDAGRAVEAVLAAIAAGVRAEEKVTISGFGTFRKRHRKARVALNPLTQQPVKIKASRTVGFSASPALKEAM